MVEVTNIQKEKKSTLSLLEDVVRKFWERSFVGTDSNLYRSVLKAVEKPLIEYALDKTRGNQLKAAKILGINRNTLRSKIRNFGIEVSRWKI